MKLLEGKQGLVFGVANDHSLGWAIARAAALQGARVGLNYHDDRLLRRVKPLADQIDAALLAPCDVTDEAAVDAFFTRASEVFEGHLDFVVHSLAFADRDDLLGRYVDTKRAGHALALDVSAYSLTALARRAAPLMLGGGSIVTLTYYGAEKAVPGYGVMGVAKAALEAAVRYLAVDLGPSGIRVNAVSAGPVRTLASAGIPGFREMLKAAADKAPLKRNITPGEVGDVGTFLLSDMSSGITGEVLHVDAGYHAVGI
jgi:enoyl-[acyl-carrier protein] reductase I